MKKFVLTLFLSSIIHQIPTFSQVVAAVYDAKSDINAANNYVIALKGFGEAVKMTQHLQETYKLFKTAQEALSKVNRVLNDIETVQNITRRHVYLVKSYSYYYNKASKFKYVSASSLRRYTNHVNYILNDAQQILKISELVLRDDYLSMSDADRMKFLITNEDDLKKQQMLLDTEYNSLKSEEEAGTIRDAIKKF